MLILQKTKIYVYGSKSRSSCIRLGANRDKNTDKNRDNVNSVWLGHNLANRGRRRRRRKEKEKKEKEEREKEWHANKSSIEWRKMWTIIFKMKKRSIFFCINKLEIEIHEVDDNNDDNQLNLNKEELKQAMKESRKKKLLSLSFH